MGAEGVRNLKSGLATESKRTGFQHLFDPQKEFPHEHNYV
jgi:hypothetical protein